ncbi:hypothetical protein RQP46_009839 [Phenoliferia psychrophenolica]
MSRDVSKSSAASSSSSGLPTPGRLSRPVSPQKPSPALSSTSNFAPAAGGTSIRRGSTLSPTGPRGLVSPTGSRNIVSPVLSNASFSRTTGPGKGFVSPVGGTMQRQTSRTSSFGAESIMSEEPLPEETSPEGDEPSLEEEEEPEPERPPPPPEEKPDPFSLKQVERPRLAEATVPKAEFDQLVSKMHLVEKRRAEDRERIRDFERLQVEAEDWGKIKEKSKAKIVELSSELRELRKQHKDLNTERDQLSDKVEDLTDQLEISLLDKEVAEERFEIADSAQESLKERVAELEIEVEVLREENAKFEDQGEEALRAESGGGGGGGDGARSSLAFIQLEKQNERLKDALLRLRDLTHEAEEENKHRIADLEKELDLTGDLQVIFDNKLVELERAEGQIEDLKQQLDDALGAEDMLEQLTERNLNLSEKIEEMLVAIEDLEALKELNDELEESHLETEKQMQDEIDMKDLVIREQQSRSDSLEDRVVDYEGIITQFRDLANNLQSDIDQLREHQASQQTESQSLTSQSQAMLNLNLKLQSSVLKGQVKTIELELRKLDAQQAMEHLSIVKPYLLPAFFEEDSDAVDSLLFFERLAHKADLVSMVIEQNHSVSDSLNSTVPETLVAICETRAKLGLFSALNKRFAAQLKRCSPEIFLKMGRVYREVVGTEKRVDSFIDALRKEELREVECGREVDGFIAQAKHLAELHLQESHLDLAEREQSYIASLDLDLDTIAAAAGFSKQALAMISIDPDVELDIGDASLDDMLFKPLQQLLNQARTSKVVTKKLLRSLDDLVSNSSALSMEHITGFENLAYNSSALATACAKLAADIATYCADVRASKHAFQPPRVIAIAQDAALELGKQTARPIEEISALLAQLSQNVAITLAAAMDSDHVVKLSYDPPWVARVAELQSTAAVNVDAERKVIKLNEEMRDLVREMRTKDQSYQESAVKIELMEKRMEAVKKQADAISELESELQKSKKQERAYEEAIEALQSDLDAMEQELNKLKQTVSVADKQGNSNAAHDGEVVSYEGNMETSRLIEQIDSLRGAVRFLRSENSYLKSQDLLSELDQLPLYTVTSSSPPLPSTPGSVGATRKEGGIRLAVTFSKTASLQIAFLVGGFTLLPLALACFVGFIFYTSRVVDLPRKTGIPRADETPDDEAELVKLYRAGWLTVRRTYEPLLGPGEGTYVGALVSGYRSFMDNRSRDPRRIKPKDKFYGVLKQNVLFLYNNEEQVDCWAAIEVTAHDVLVYPEGCLDGELFVKRNAVCLRPKSVSCDSALAAHLATEETTHDMDADKPFPWFIFAKVNTDKEDWYHSLVEASKLGTATTTATLAKDRSMFDPDDMARLVEGIDQQPDSIPMRWLNALFGRIFLAVYRTESLEAYITSRIVRKLKRVKTPSILSEVQVREVNVGSAAPFFSKPMLKELTPDGDASMEVHLSYVGDLRITIETVATINLGSRFKPYSVRLVLAVVLKEIEGTLLFKIKKPPSNRVWFGFSTMPRMVLSVEPVVSTRQISWSMITSPIESRIREVILESIVVPHMDDFPFFNSSELFHRGGIWGDALRKEHDLSTPAGGQGDEATAIGHDEAIDDESLDQPSGTSTAREEGAEGSGARQRPQRRRRSSEGAIPTLSTTDAPPSSSSTSRNSPPSSIKGGLASSTSSLSGFSLARETQELVRGSIRNRNGKHDSNLAVEPFFQSYVDFFDPRDDFGRGAGTAAGLVGDSIEGLAGEESEGEGEGEGEGEDTA